MYYNTRKLIECDVNWDGVHVFVFMLSYVLHIINLGQYSLQMLKFGTWTKCVCIDLTEVAIASLTLSTVATPSRNVSFSLSSVDYQWTVVPRAPCQMDRDATPALLLGAESLTPVTQGTG